MSYDNLLYLNDSYIKEFDAEVISVMDGKFVVLDKTAFYPNAGGQLHDTGTLVTDDGREFEVVFVAKIKDDVSHEVKPKDSSYDMLKTGDKVHGSIDWERRYKLMRSHTAAHVVSGVISQELGAKIHGNQKTMEKIRIDFDTEHFDKDYLKDLVDKSNRIMAGENPVKTYFVEKSDMEEDPSMMKLAKGLPDSVQEVRIVEITGFDKQPCGGTHVKNLSEIGDIEFLKAENRGKNNRRLYFKLKDDREG
ncbi:MAG: alanine--tRNA ligase-related protein [Candidatus Woesearchaeota archaeon]